MTIDITFGKLAPVHIRHHETHALIYANGERIGDVWRYTLPVGKWRAARSYFARLWADDVELEETVRYSAYQKIQSQEQAAAALKRRIADHLTAKEAQASIDANEPIESYLLRTCEG